LILDHNIRYLNITKWVTDKRENSLEKLVNVYDVLSNEECNIALVFHRSSCAVHVFLAISNRKNASDNVDAENFKRRLKDSIRGNFPGSEWENDGGAGVIPCLDEVSGRSVACASNVPAEKSEKFVSQTIEKLLDGIVPQNRRQEYTVVLLATPVQDIENRKLRLSEFYSGLAPYASWQTGFTYNTSDSTSSTALFGVNVGASAGVQNGQNQAITNGSGTTDSSGSSQTDSTGKTQGQSTGTTDAQGSSHSEGANTSHQEGSTGSIGVSHGIEASVGHSSTDSVGKTVADSATKSTAKSITDTLSQSTWPCYRQFAWKGCVQHGLKDSGNLC
jgi:hypothetical protein